MLIVFLGAKSGGLSFYDRRWNRLERRLGSLTPSSKLTSLLLTYTLFKPYYLLLERGLGALLLSLPDADYLASDGYDVQDRNYQEQEQTQGDGWEHGALVDIREKGFNEAHVVIAEEEEDEPRDDEYHDVQRMVST